MKNHVRALDSSVTQHSIEAKKVFPHDHSHPFELYGAINYSREGGKHYHSDDGSAFFGLDTSYDNFVLKRTCAIGVVGGFVGDSIDYKLDMAKTGNLRMGFGGYYCNFHIWGMDVSTLSILGFGKSATDCEPLSIGGYDFQHFTHKHRIMHSKIDVFYAWKWRGLKIGPNVALRIDNLKQDGAKEWQQNALRLKTIDLVGGIKLEKDSKKFYTHCFMGMERNVRERWSGGEIEVAHVSEPLSANLCDKTKFLITTGIHFPCSESCFLNFTFSGRYGKNDKSSTIGLTFNRVF
jgi:hypothetical protein